MNDKIILRRQVADHCRDPLVMGEAKETKKRMIAMAHGLELLTFFKILAL